MKFNHVGIPVQASVAGEMNLPHLMMTASDHENNPYTFTGSVTGRMLPSLN